MPTVLEPRVAGEFPGGAQALRVSDAPGGDPRASPLGDRPRAGGASPPRLAASL